MRTPALLLLILAACTANLPAQDELESVVTEKSLLVWELSSMPSVPRACHPEAFQFRHPATQEAFLALCPPALACFRWETVTPCALCETVFYPTAVVKPGSDPDLLPLIGVHELAHGLLSCSAPLSRFDPADSKHTRLDVWGTDGGRVTSGSGDSLVRRALDLVLEIVGESEETPEDHEADSTDRSRNSPVGLVPGAPALL